MAKVVLKSAIKREKGKMYFISKGGDVMEATMNRKGGKKGRTVSCRATSKKKKTTKKKSSTKRKTSGKKKTTKKVTLNMRKKSPAKKKRKTSKKK